MSAATGPRFGVLVGTLLAAQTVGTMATMVLPAVAPRVADTYGVSASLIGYQISLLAAAMVVSLVFGAHLSLRWGPTRVTQASLVLLTGGCVVAILPHVGFVFASAIALGLGYGLLTPSASHLLMRFTPANRRNVVFSLKQTGVPLGGIAAALVAPPVAVAFGWQWALALTAILLVILIAPLESGRAQWDDDRDPAVSLAVHPLGGVAGIWRNPALRLLSLSGACFVIVQICLSTFTVVLFAEEMQTGLIVAGLVLTASQLGGVAGRVFWGWMADVMRSCFSALAVLAAVMLAGSLAILAVTPAVPLAVSCVLFFVLGSTASGWNGAFLAEVARLSPRHEVSTTTGGSLVFVNVGKLLGPIAFTNAYLAGGSYALAFALLAIPAGAGLACVLAARHGELRSAQPAAH